MTSDLGVGRKIGEFPIAFSVQGAGGSATGLDTENTMADQDTGIPVRPISSGLQVSGETGHCRARSRKP